MPNNDRHASREAQQDAREGRQEARHDAREGRQEAWQDKQDIKELFAELKAADEFYVADFNALNDSGVEGFALLTVDRGDPNTTADDTLTVRIVASGLDEGVHLQHMHGFETGQDAVTPTFADNSDGDKKIELLEGLPKYGQILLNLDDSSGNFPVTVQNGSFVFDQTYHLPDAGMTDHNASSHAGDTVTTFENLDLNHLVIHGAFVDREDGLNSEGDATTGEVNGTAGYALVLPVSVGEIEQVSFGEAHQFLKQVYSAGFDLVA